MRDQDVWARAPVPGAEQLEHALGRQLRDPHPRDPGLLVGEDLEQVVADVAQPSRRVAQDDGAVAVVVELEAGEEPRHRAAVAVPPLSAIVAHLQAEAVAAVPALPTDIVDDARLAHLHERVGAQQVGALAGEERRPAREVRNRRPQLPGRRHRARVVLGLGEHQIGPGVDGEARRRRRLRARGRATSSRAAPAARRRRPRPSGRPGSSQRSRRARRTRRWSSETGGPRRTACHRAAWSAPAARSRRQALAPTTRRRSRRADRPNARAAVRSSARRCPCPGGNGRRCRAAAARPRRAAASRIPR